MAKKNKLLILLIALGAFLLMAAGDVDLLSSDGDVAISSPSDGQVLVFNGTLGKWQNRARGPTTVARQSFLNHALNIPTTTIFTPSVEGDFRISEYIVVTAANDNSAVNSTFSWTDPQRTQATDNGAGNPQILSNPTVPGGAYVYNVLTVHSVANAGITFSASTTCNGYDVFITVEKL